MNNNLIDTFYEIYNKVTEISSYEELIVEIDKMKGSKKEDIIAKLKLIISIKKISDYGKRRLYALVSTLEDLNETEINLFIYATRKSLVEEPKIELEQEIDKFVIAMEESNDPSWDFYIALAKYFEDLCKTRYDFMEHISLMLTRSIEQEREGQIVDINVDAIYEGLKNLRNNDNNKLT